MKFTTSTIIALVAGSSLFLPSLALPQTGKPATVAKLAGGGGSSGKPRHLGHQPHGKHHHNHHHASAKHKNVDTHGSAGGSGGKLRHPGHHPRGKHHHNHHHANAKHSLKNIVKPKSSGKEAHAERIRALKRRPSQIKMAKRELELESDLLEARQKHGKWGKGKSEGNIHHAGGNGGKYGDVAHIIQKKAKRDLEDLVDLAVRALEERDLAYGLEDLAERDLGAWDELD